MYGCGFQVISFCCGFYTAGEFQSGHENNSRFSDHRAETVESLVTKLMNHAEGRSILFNFVRHEICDFDGEFTGEWDEEYEAKDLRDYVRNHPNVMSIGEWVNPGTNNKIDGYIIKDYL